MKIDIIQRPIQTDLVQPCFKDVIGQEGVKKYLSFLIESHAPATPFPTLLLTGSQGLGKTFISEKIANSLGRKFVEVNSETVSTVKELVEDIIVKQVMGEREVTLLLDEAHALNKEVTNFLLSLLSPNISMRNTFRHGDIDFVFDMRKINVIFATTDSYRMFAPLLNRCEEVYLYPYSNIESYCIVRFYSRPVEIWDSIDTEEIAYVARNRARNGFKLAQNIKRIASISEHKHMLMPEDWERLKSVLGLYPLGLKQNEVNLIKVIRDLQPVSSANLAIRLMVNENNIKEELELRPRELGLIQSTNRGRILTEKGKDYLNNLVMEKA